MIDLSIVVPVFNSGPLISNFVGRVLAYLDGRDSPGELILVDDGSDPATWAAVAAAAEQDSRIIGIRLDRNYGQHTALMHVLHRPVEVATQCGPIILQIYIVPLILKPYED